MNYKDTLDFMFSQLPMFQRTGKAAYKANLDNTLALDKYLGHPHLQFKSIHVAGTNGKGSVSHSIAAVLQASGYKVGLYTSPHLRDFRERIKINGQSISEQDVVDFVDKHNSMLTELKPSFFEMTVGMAFDYFAREKVDIAVIEVGLGGRLDSTNIITPLLSVITNISMDHTNLLGNTLTQIAREKAGIIKGDVPVVIGERIENVDAVFVDQAEEVGATLLFASDQLSVKNSYVECNKRVYEIFRDNKICYSLLKSDLLGIYQEKNILTALCAIEQLEKIGVAIGMDSIYKGIANASTMTGLMGRWQVLQNNPMVVCDTGHNEAGISDILRQLKTCNYERLLIVIGMVDDKNIEGVLDMLPRQAMYFFTRASIPRALDENILREKAAKFGLSGQCYSSVKEAFDAAVKEAHQKDMVFVGGSTFIVAEVV